MRLKFLVRTLFVLALALGLGTQPASAQAPIDPANLPARTIFYAVWRGAPPADVHNSNALLGLWDDAGFAPIRSAMLDSMLSSSKHDKAAASDRLSEFLPLLDNAFVFGYLAEPEGHRKSSNATPPPATRPWNGLFFVYNRSGKEALVAKALLGLRSESKSIPKITPVTIAGISALKVEDTSETTYWAEQGKFAVSAKERSVFEDIVNRVYGSAPAAASLAQDSAFQEAKPLLGSGLCEFFLRIPNIDELAKNAPASMSQLRPIGNALKLDSLHAIAIHLSLEGSRTRLQGALLGDASAGTLFDIFGDGLDAPGALLPSSSDAVSVSEFQLNFSGIYETVKRALRSTLTQQQQGTIDLYEALAQAQLGMPLSEAMAIPTGEIVNLQTGRTMEPTKQVVLFGIRKKPETLKLLHTMLAGKIASEQNDGETTFLKISLNSTQTGAGEAGWNFYHLAVTGDRIVAAPSKAALMSGLRSASTTAGGSANELFTQWQASRSQFPARINGFSYYDLKKLDWQALKDKWIEGQKQVPGKAKAAAASTSPMNAPEWLIHTDAAVFSRHLHSATSATWKDAHGIHFDQWID